MACRKTDLDDDRKTGTSEQGRIKFKRFECVNLHVVSSIDTYTSTPDKHGLPGIWIYGLDLLPNTMYQFEFEQGKNQQTRVTFNVEDRKSGWFSSSDDLDNSSFDPFSGSQVHHFRIRTPLLDDNTVTSSDDGQTIHGDFDCFIHLLYEFRPRGLTEIKDIDNYFRVKCVLPFNSSVATDSNVTAIDSSVTATDSSVTATDSSVTAIDSNVATTGKSHGNRLCIVTSQGSRMKPDGMIRSLTTFQYLHISPTTRTLAEEISKREEGLLFLVFDEAVENLTFHSNFSLQLRNILLYLVENGKESDAIIWCQPSVEDISVLDKITSPLTGLSSKNIDWKKYLSVISLSPRAYRFLVKLVDQLEEPNLALPRIWIETLEHFHKQGSVLFCNPGLFCLANMGHQDLSHKNLKRVEYILPLPNLDPVHAVTVFLVIDDKIITSDMVRKAVENIKEQTYPNINIVIVDYLGIFTLGQLATSGQPVASGHLGDDWSRLNIATLDENLDRVGTCFPWFVLYHRATACSTVYTCGMTGIESQDNSLCLSKRVSLVSLKALYMSLPVIAVSWMETSFRQLREKNKRSGEWARVGPVQDKFY